MSHITIYRIGIAADLVPVPATPERSWWSVDWKTRNHAHHCLPLTMANSLGYLILSPGDFRITWDGTWDSDVRAEQTPGGAQCLVDNHSAHGAFTVQPGFLPRTHEVGDFIYIKSIPNRRDAWFTVMEGLIEAWWQPGEFGLVCTMNRPGTFSVARGEPIAQMAVYKAEGGCATMEVTEVTPPDTDSWRQRRSRPEYVKDLDYLRGRYPDGRFEPTHIRQWRRKPTR